MSDRASEKIFIALCVAFTAVASIHWTATPALQRYLPGVITAATTLLILAVMLRAGILSTMVMFITYTLLIRTPMTFDSSSLLVGSTWLTLALAFGLASIGFRLATRQSHALRGARAAM